MHRALDLPLAQERVHGAPDVVRGDDPVDRAGLAVDDDQLRRVPERRVDDGMLETFGERVRPVDAVLALVVDARVDIRRPSRRAHASATAPAPINVPRLPVV